MTYSEIQNYIKNQYLDIKNRYGVKYLYSGIVTVTFAILLAAGYFAHGYYVQQRETRAFVGFREVVNSYREARDAVKDLSDKDKIAEQWQNVEFLLDAVYGENTSSYLAPYFLMYRADIMLAKGESVDVVREEVDRALRMIPFDTALYNLFLLKRIKMGLDSQDAQVRENSLRDLTELASSPKRHMYEEAVYLLGLYQINNGNIPEARETWNRLLDDSVEIPDYVGESPWKKVVDDKLKPAS